MSQPEDNRQTPRADINVHALAHVFAWVCADPTDRRTPAALRGTCRAAVRAFDVAVHAGWVVMALHRNDVPEEEGATCRWATGWMPASFSVAVSLTYRGAPALLRLEHMLLDDSHAQLPQARAADPLPWVAPHVAVCETLDPRKLSHVAHAPSPADVTVSVVSNGVRYQSLPRVRGTLFSWILSSMRPRAVDIHGAAADAMRLEAASFAIGMKSLEEFSVSRPTSIRMIGGSFLAGAAKLQHFDSSGLTGVTEIGGNFLARCTALTSIDTTGFAAVRRVGESFLSDCTSLRSVDVSSFRSLECIGNHFLGECSALEEFHAPAATELRNIPSMFLSKCRQLTHVDLRGFTSVTRIGAHMLSQCTALESVDTDGLQSVTYIEAFFALGCTKLKAINTRGLCNVAEVESHFAAGCTALTDIDMARMPNLEVVGTYFLNNAESLQSLSLVRPLLASPPRLGSTMTTDARVTTPGDFLKGCRSLTSLQLPPWSVGGDDNGDSEGAEVIVAAGFLSRCTSLKFDVSPIRMAGVLRDDFLFGASALRHFDTAGLDRVTTIGNSFLAFCYNLAEVNTSGLVNVRTIGHDFLASCPQLTLVTTNGLRRLQSVGDRFLDQCTSLRRVVLSGCTSLTRVGESFGALLSCPALDLSPCVALCNVGNAFLEGSALESVILGPLPLVTIPHNTLTRCRSLHSLTTQSLDTLTIIQDRFACTCPSLTSVDLSGLAGVLTIGSHFLAYAVALRELRGIDRMTSLEQVGDHFLAGAKSLEHFDTHGWERVRRIDSHFLAYSDGIRRVDLGGLAKLEQVPDLFLTECVSLEALDTAGLSAATTINASFAHGCTSLRHVDMRGLVNVTKVHKEFLRKCTALTELSNTEALPGSADVASGFASDCPNLRSPLPSCVFRL